MGHAIRDAAHAIMPRMLLVCAGSTSPARAGSSGSVNVFTSPQSNRGGYGVAIGWQPSDKGGDDAKDLLPTVSVRLHPHDRSAGPRPQPAAPAPRAARGARRWGRGLLWFSSLASQQGRVSRGALPVAGQRQRPAAPRRRRTPALTRSRSALPGCH
jgi:hypothetical protein